MQSALLTLIEVGALAVPEVPEPFIFLQACGVWDWAECDHMRVERVAVSVSGPDAPIRRASEQFSQRSSL